MTKESIYAFWPYLKTSESIRYQGLTVRSTGDKAGLPRRVSKDIGAIHRTFYLQNHLRIRDMMCCHVDLRSDNSEREVVKKLLELRILLGYLYTSPGPGRGDPFLRWEHADLFTFWPNKVSKHVVWPEHNVEMVPKNRKRPEGNRWGEVDGYEGLLNNRTHLWVANGSCLYPPSPRLWLNVAQDTYAELHQCLYAWNANPVFVYFFSEEREVDLDDRFLTSLTWYNRSASVDENPESKIINFAIAFESLLGLEQKEGVAVRLKESVNLLLGKIPRLDSWLEQFYGARSEIIHEGRSHGLRFIASDLKRRRKPAPGSTYRSLLSYGRLVFRACANAILTGTQSAIKLRLPSMMVTNKQRLEKICRTLSAGDSKPEQLLLSVEQDILDIDRYQFEPEDDLTFTLILGAARSLTRQYLKAMPSAAGSHLPELEAFAKHAQSQDHFAELEALKKLDDFVESTHRRNPNQEDKLSSLVATLLGTAWRWSFMYFFALEEERKKARTQAQGASTGTVPAGGGT